MPTQINERARAVLKEVKEFLQKLINENNLIQYYWEASQKAEELILCFLGKEEYCFPIDIEKLAKKMGLYIEEDKLDAFSNRKDVNKRIGQIIVQEEPFSGEINATIYLEQSISPASKRYAIAHELVHYILHDNERNYYEDYCLMPLCPIRIEEIVADIFATFLLIPVQLFFNEFYDYVCQRTQQDNVPIATEYWLRHLSERALIPEYYVAYGYQQLRYVGHWIYQAWMRVEKYTQEASGDMESMEEEQETDTVQEIDVEQENKEAEEIEHASVEKQENEPEINSEELQNEQKLQRDQELQKLQEAMKIQKETAAYFNKQMMELLFQ